MKSIRKSPIITGTIILTATGLITRLIGFFYRTFLSRQFGEEGMGIYQLVSPVLSISYALCVSGIQTAISKFVATYFALQNKKKCIYTLLIGLILSLSISIPFSVLTYLGSDWIAPFILKEARCASLIRILSLSVPFGAVHSCVNGYYLGMKKTKIPASSQLVEQIFRVLTVAVICHFLISQGQIPSLDVCVIGLLVGEIVAMCFSLLYFKSHIYGIPNLFQEIPKQRAIAKDIFSMSSILTLSRLFLTLFASAETILLPRQLMKYGFTNSEALSIYGVFTGMALPLILFPNALTSSISTLLLPTVSEADSGQNYVRIKNIIRKTFLFCFTLGATCTVFFLFCGKTMGVLFFHSEAAGNYIMKLSFICPLLYLTSTLVSIINGFGKTIYTFYLQLCGLSFRLFFLLFFVPRIGMNGYIAGLILSQFVQTILCMCMIVHIYKEKTEQKEGIPA